MKNFMLTKLTKIKIYNFIFYFNSGLRGEPVSSEQLPGVGFLLSEVCWIKYEIIQFQFLWNMSALCFHWISWKPRASKDCADIFHKKWNCIISYSIQQTSLTNSTHPWQMSYRDVNHNELLSDSPSSLLTKKIFTATEVPKKASKTSPTKAPTREAIVDTAPIPRITLDASE